MKFHLICLGLLASVLLAATAPAQILVDASMTVGEGGAARASGLVFADRSGSFDIGFGAGSLRSVRMSRFTSVFIPGLTAGFEGPAVATIDSNGQTRTVRGTCFVMVDDLASVSAPDQLFLLFTATSGTGTIVRHATVNRGDIMVITQ